MIYLLTQARVPRVRGANWFKMPQRSSSSSTLKTPNPCGLRSFLACILALTHTLSLSIQSRTNPHKHAMLMRERSQGRAIDCRRKDLIAVPILLAMMTTLDVRFSLSVSLSLSVVLQLRAPLCLRLSCFVCSLLHVLSLFLYQHTSFLEDLVCYWRDVAECRTPQKSGGTPDSFSDVLLQHSSLVSID